MMVLNYYLSGPYYPRGGSGALRDALLEALKNNGAQLQNHARVSRIEKRGQNFMVTIDSGERYSARVVISNAHPALTLGHLVDPQIVPDRVRNKAARLRPSMGAYCAFVGTDLDLPALGITSGNIHHFDSLDVNEVYHALNTTTLLERTPFCFITSPSVKDPQGAHAPAGRHTVEVVTCASYEGLGHWAGLPSRHRGEEYQQIKERVGQRLIDAAEQHIPGLSRRLDVVEYASPLTGEYWVNAPQGAMYGPELTPDQMGGGRFAGGVTGVEGLYLAGAGVIAGGVSACLASGLMAGIEASDYLAKPT
jgi:all-trans-retinol 13,14-reductase